MPLKKTKPIFFILIFLINLPFTVYCQKEFSSASAEKPNILIIISDDLGWNDVGYHGSEIKTPNIDKLAETGICLEQHYAMPTCTPTRVSLMTGKYPSRYGILGPDYGEVINLGDPTLASILSENGYFTAIAGKWHLGSPPYTPLKYGFQSSYGYFDGQIDPYTHEYKTETKFTSRKSWHRNDEYFDEEGHVTDLLTAEAIRIIEEKREKPFFLYVAHHVPHYPLDEPEKWMSLYDALSMHPSRKLFAASVSHMDDGIGKILEALERTGKRDNTLILFFSDNGGQHSWHSTTDYQGKYTNKPHSVLGNNYPLTGWKGDLYEGGIRLPAIANWPGKIESKILNSPIHMVDWLPTLIHLTGNTNSGKKLYLDGKDILPLLFNKECEYKAHPFYWKTNKAYAVRDDKWKLIEYRSNDKIELFDIESDFRETQDLSVKYPDVVLKMKGLLAEFKLKDRDRK